MSVEARRVATSPLFAALSPDELTRIATRMEERHASPGDRLTIQGSSGYFFFMIEDGTAEVSHDGHVIAQLGPGDFFGETAILEQHRRNATVTASTPMTMAVMFGADFAQLAVDQPSIGEKVRAAIDERRPAE